MTASLYTPGGLPLPDLDDPPNVPADLLALAGELDLRVENRFNTLGDRDATLPSAATPIGTRCLVLTTGRRYIAWPTATGIQWFELIQGRVSVATDAARDSLLIAPDGMEVLNNGVVQVRRGTTWVPPLARCFMYLSATVTGYNGTWNDAFLNAHTIDTHGGHAGAANPTASAATYRYVVQPGQGGRYRVGGGIAIAMPATGRAVVSARISKNGAQFIGSTGTAIYQNASESPQVVTGDKIIDAVPGDWFVLQHICGNGPYNTPVYPDAGGWMSIEQIN